MAGFSYAALRTRSRKDDLADFIEEVHFQGICNIANSPDAFHHSFAAKRLVNLVDDTIEYYIPDGPGTRHMLTSTGAIITGPATTHIINASLNPPSQAVDIVTPSGTFDVMLNWILNSFDMHVVDYDYQPPGLDPRSYRCAVTVKGATQVSAVNVIRSTKANAAYTAAHQYSSHVLNVVTGQGVSCAYPGHTLLQQGILRWTTSRETDALIPTNFTVAGGQVLPGERVCNVSSTCPKVSRTFIDLRALTMSYEPGGCLSHTLAEVSWKLGGEGCADGCKCKVASVTY